MRYTKTKMAMKSYPLSLKMAKKKVDDYGYKKLSGSLRGMIKASNIDTSWMDRLPGGTWKDPDVLRNYMIEQLKRSIDEQKDHRGETTNQQAKYGVDDRDTNYGQTGCLF